MMPLPVSFSEQAYRDLDGIYDYILLISGSAAAARSYTDNIIDFCERIGWIPAGGYRVRWQGKELHRRLFERSIYIIYEVGNDRVEVIRLISVRRNEPDLR